MLNCQSTKFDYYDTDLKNDRIIYYSHNEESEVGSLDCICVQQNHQIHLPQTLNSNELDMSEESYNEFSINIIPNDMQVSEFKKYEPSDLSSITEYVYANGNHIAGYIETPPKIKRTEKINLNYSNCKIPDNNNRQTLDESPVKDFSKSSNSPFKVGKGVRVEKSSSLAVKSDCNMIESDLKKFYENKHRFKKEEFHHFVDLGKRDSYNDFINGN